MKVQEYRGIKGLVGAEVLTDDSTGITFGEVFPIVPVAELVKTTETNSETKYYDNVPAIVIDSTGSDTVTVQGAVIPYDVLAKITGQEYDADLGMFVEGERTAKYFAIGYVTDTTSNEEVFVWRFKGKFGIPDSTHATKNDGTDSNGQELVFTGINTTYKFNKTNKTAKAINVNTTENPYDEADFFGAVLTPDTVTKQV